MSSAKKQAPQFHIGDWVTFHYGPRKVSAKVVEDRGPLGVRGRRLYRVQIDEELGDASSFEMPEDELETVTAPVRQSFQVKYSRQGNTNAWQAITKRDGLIKGVKAKGAVGYSTGMWEGETIDDQRHATVAVLLEVDPRSSEVGIADDPDLRRELAKRAQSLADEMFLSRHPRAQIQHSPPGE
jgi:hypothetical protein